MALQGIDISSWQTGINLAAVPCDFVIIKASEGVGYVSPTWGEQINTTLSLGKKAGAYHYANGYAATTEADLFLSQFAPYVGRAIPVLDWESGGNMQWGNGGWVRDWVTHVHNRTGAWPLVYVQSSAISQIPGDVQATCGLWVAQYADMNPTGYQDVPWNEGAYACVMRQYSGTGTLPGYGGQLDLNKFYGGDSDWDSLAQGKYTMESEDIMVSAQEVAEAVWNFNQNGTLMRDRVQGVDEGVQNVNKRLFSGSDEFKWLTNRIYRIADLLFNRKDNAGTGMINGDGTPVERSLYERVAWIDKRVHELNTQGVGTTDKILDINKRMDVLEEKLDAILHIIEPSKNQ